MTREPDSYLNARIRVIEAILAGRQVDPRTLRRLGYHRGRKRSGR